MVWLALKYAQDKQLIGEADIQDDQDNGVSLSRPDPLATPSAA